MVLADPPDPPATLSPTSDRCMDPCGREKVNTVGAKNCPMRWESLSSLLDDAPPLPEMKAAVEDGDKRPSTAPLWDVVSGYGKPIMFVRGMRKQSVVTDEDEAELVKRAPHARVEHVQEAGHSVQGDTPLELAALLRDFAGL